MKTSLSLCILGLVTLTAFVGCSSVPHKAKVKAVAIPTGAKVDLDNVHQVKKNLYAQYEQWKNTRYQLGGLSRDGIDCSGFIYVTFKSRLGIILPRSTEFQAELGEKIDKSKLRAGDLVFFRTGWSVRHVGIYLEHGKFLHASTKYGVTISGLTEDYWKSAYWKAKRLDS
ncbi:MAG: glycoside hydrolase [Nitrosospira sp. 56-18]|jgi:cell wall-associated NlpC family hydrolase|nr:C40 family peptidase [Nitrosospira sp.]OJY07792.1 MAG: glycoside hydrolase [Nitrosospira sp. 56-18]